MVVVEQRLVGASIGRTAVKIKRASETSGRPPRLGSRAIGPTTPGFSAPLILTGLPPLVTLEDVAQHAASIERAGEALRHLAVKSTPWSPRMKFGFRIPSLRKRIAARTSWKRFVRHNLGLKAPRGWGWLTNPKKALYNRIYRRTTFGIEDLFKTRRRRSSAGCLAVLLALVSLVVVAGACVARWP